MAITRLLPAAIARFVPTAIARLVPTAIARFVPTAIALLVVVALSSCGGGAATVTKPTTHGKHQAPPYVDIYAGLPLSGPMAPEGHAILNGIRLAFHTLRTHSGNLQIHLKRPLNDSGEKTGDGNLKRTLENAAAVARDPHAVYYIGDVGSAATAVSLPVLSAAGIAQMTPGDPFLAPPSAARSGSAALASKLLRLLPSDTVQAAADVLFFKEFPPHVTGSACTHVLAFAQGDPESEAGVLVNAIYAYAKAHANADGIQMPKPTILTGKTNSLTSTQAMALQHQNPLTCGLVIAGSGLKPAVALTKLLHSFFPHAFIVDTSGLCSPVSKWDRMVAHEIPEIADSLLWCTSPLLPLDQYAALGHFVELYKRAYQGRYPSRYAFYGYEAADLGIAMIDDYLGAQGDNRVQMRTDLSQTLIRQSIASPYGYLTNGDSSLNSYGVYRVNPTNGKPVFDTTLRP